MNSVLFVAAAFVFVILANRKLKTLTLRLEQRIDQLHNQES